MKVAEHLSIRTLYRPIEVRALDVHVVRLGSVVLAQRLERVDVALPAVSAQEVALPDALRRQLPVWHRELDGHLVFQLLHALDFLFLLFGGVFLLLRHHGRFLVVVRFHCFLLFDLFLVFKFVVLGLVKHELGGVEVVLPAGQQLLRMAMMMLLLAFWNRLAACLCLLPFLLSPLCLPRLLVCLLFLVVAHFELPIQGHGGQRGPGAMPHHFIRKQDLRFREVLLIILRSERLHISIFLITFIIILLNLS